MGAGTKEVATIEALPDKVNFLKIDRNKEKSKYQIETKLQASKLRLFKILPTECRV